MRQAYAKGTVYEVPRPDLAARLEREVKARWQPQKPGGELWHQVMQRGAVSGGR